MSDAISISNKLYQRGQTWSECLACWQSQREDLLNTLEKMPSSTLQLPADLRFLVWFNPDVISPQLCLLLKLFADNDRARFFSKHIFFAPLHGVFGRHDPALVALNASNLVLGEPCWLQSDQSETWHVQLKDFLSDF